MGHSTVAAVSVGQLFGLVATVVGLVTVYFRHRLAGVIATLRSASRP